MSKSDKDFVEAVNKFRGSISADSKPELIRRTEERLEFAKAINRFSDVQYFETMLTYLENS